jgi:hypothetical protein
MPDVFSHAGLSTLKKQLRFTSHRAAREKRLVQDPVRFLELGGPMTRIQAAESLRDDPRCQSPDWQEAIARELRMGRSAGKRL